MNNTLAEKKKKLKELHELENSINKEISQLDKKIYECNHIINKVNIQKKKLAKRVSHNMKLRHVIINEILGIPNK